MATDKKDVILKRIENEKRCTKSRLMNFCGATSDQVASATKVLEAEGKIKVWPGIREGAVIYTLPGIDKNYEPSIGEGTAKNDATKASIPPRRVNRTSATPPIKTRAKSGRPKPADVPTNPAGAPCPKNGGGSAENSLKDLPSFRRIQNYNLQLTAAMVHGDPEGIDEALEEIACTALDWRRERRATA